MAGLAAARELSSRGFDVTIVEGRDRIGGRIWTDRSLGAALDLGASWIHGIRGNPVASLARSFGVQTRPTDFEALALYDRDGRMLSDQELESLYDQLDELAEELDARKAAADEKLSVGRLIPPLLAKPNIAEPVRRGLLWAAGAAIMLEYAADLEDLALLGWDEEDTFSALRWFFPMAMQRSSSRSAGGWTSSWSKLSGESTMVRRASGSRRNGVNFRATGPSSPCRWAY